MANKTRTAYFARINRRQENLLSDLVEARDFRADMLRLVESQRTVATARGRQWYAADFEVDPTATYVTGVLGYASEETFVQFDDEAFSWSKGETEEVVGATVKTMVPFAVDLRSQRRYVCFSVTQLIHPAGFCEALSAVLTAASGAAGWEGLIWEVDMISDSTELAAFIASNPNLTMVRRTVRRPNPSGEYLEDDLKRMDALSASQKSTMYRIPPNRPVSEAGKSLITAGVEEGFTDVALESRSEGIVQRFDSRKRRKRTLISNYGTRLKEVGGDALLRALSKLEGASTEVSLFEGQELDAATKQRADDT